MTLEPAGSTEELADSTSSTKQVYGRLAVVGLVLVALVVAVQYLGRGPARRLGLLPRPEAFTELFFAHPERLPSTARIDHPLGIVFVIDNREGVRWTYHWEVRVSAGRQNRQVASGALAIADGRSSSITIDIVPALRAEAETISVRLQDPAQSIDYHVQAG